MLHITGRHKPEAMMSLLDLQQVSPKIQSSDINNRYGISALEDVHRYCCTSLGGGLGAMDVTVYQCGAALPDPGVAVHILRSHTAR